MTYSTGTEFEKALADALAEKDEHSIEQAQRIKAFINDHTSFRVTNITLVEGNQLTMKAVRGN